MSIIERLQATEALWDSLLDEESEIESPEWHQDILEERKKRKILKHLDLWDVKRKPRPVANAPPIDVVPAYDEQPVPSSDDYIRDPEYPAEAYFKKILSGKTGCIYQKSNIFKRFQPIAGLTLRSSFCIWVFIGWSRLGLGAASAAAQYVVTHLQPSHNPIDFDFLIDSLSKNEFLSFYDLLMILVLRPRK